MSFVRTLLVALVAVGLGAWIYLYEAPRLEQESKGDHVVAFDTARASHVLLTYPDQTKIELKKEGADWKVVAPITASADNDAVDRFLDGVRDTVVERRLKKDEIESLAAYGLDKPAGTQGRLEVTLEDGTKLVPVIIGNTTPVDHFAFARLEGSDEVLVTPLLIHTTIKKTPFDFRKKKLFEVQPDQIGRISIHAKDERIELERGGEKKWNLVLPKPDAADPQAAESIAGAFDTIDALAFLEGPDVDPAKLGLAEPTLTVTAHLTSGEKVGFKLGAEAPDQPAGLYLQRTGDGQIAKVPDWVPQKFGASSADLRSRAVTTCKPDDVVRMTFVQPADTYTLTREGPGKAWTMDPPPAQGQTIKQRIVDNLLRGLVDMKGDHIAGDAADDAERARFGLDAPVAKVELATKSAPCGIISAAKAAAAQPDTAAHADQAGEASNAEAGSGNRAAGADAPTVATGQPADAASGDAELARKAVMDALGDRSSAPPSDEGDAPPPAAPSVPPPRYYLQGRDRTAVVTAGEHLYSRLAMKRSELLDEPGPAPAAGKTDPDATAPAPPAAQ
ncbi:MAG TPA: DUF4340 domain-containing protein [Candidatus Binatia bacterium]|nr:DUF4340 domain-containing protein [Candidatus Binatia bacterium]